MNPITYQAKEIIFKENEKSTELYIIKSGSVRVYQFRNGTNVEIARFTNGEIFGDMSFFTDEVRTATAQALEEIGQWLASSASVLRCRRYDR